MGRVCRDDRSKRLYVDYEDHSGRRIRKPARCCVTEREAERYLHELEVGELLGHTTIQQTLQTYAHVFPKDKEAAVSLLPFGRIEPLNATDNSQVLVRTGT